MIVDEYFDEIALPILSDPIYQRMKDYYAHGAVTVYEHCLSVAIYAYEYARSKKYDIDYKALIRGALLHDFYLYDWHRSGEGHKFHGFRHPFFAYRNAKKHFNITKKEGNIIRAHMFPLVFWVFPRYKESRLIIKSDRHCAYEETFHKRKKEKRI